jgi:hypothetical protein
MCKQDNKVCHINLDLGQWIRSIYAGSGHSPALSYRARYAFWKGIKNHQISEI